MRSWQYFITCIVTAVIKTKMLNWAYSIINFINWILQTKLIKKVSNRAYSIKYTIYQRQSEKRCSTVQYSAIQLSTLQYSTVQ